jgi:uncharacterized protein with HEPN domain
MTKRNANLYIKDILDSMAKIEEYIKGLSFEDFTKNKMAIDAVVRNLEIIGEAAKNVTSEVRTKYNKIPWKEMAGMRDKTIHEYFGVDLKIIWKTVKESLPELKRALKITLQ